MTVSTSPSPQDSSPRVWALLDDRAGNTAQTRGIAQALGFAFTEIPVTYTRLVQLPNALRRTSFLGIARSTKKALLDMDTPDVIITTGRRLAPLALALKRRFPHVFLIHLMHPDCPLDGFDCVILPEHDQPQPRPNVLTSLGAPHALSPASLKELAAKATPPCKTRPIIAVLIGGDNKYGTMEVQEIDAIVDVLRPTMTPSTFLHVTTSRRTSATCVQRLKQVLSTYPHTLYTYGNHATNPYPAMLGFADAIIVTGDSVAMCTESCATGKPVFIAITHATTSPKHQRFISSLFAKGYAKPLDRFSLSWHPEQPLLEAQRLAPLLRAQYITHQKNRITS